MKVLASLIISAVALVSGERCQGENAWGDHNPNVYHICDRATNTSLTFACPPGTGFVQNDHYDGCLPYEEWQCNLDMPGLDMLPECRPDDVVTPWRHSNPNKFFMCAGGSLLVSECPSGRGYVYNEGAMGCVPWPLWREYSVCSSWLQVEDDVSLGVLEQLYSFVTNFADQLKEAIGSLRRV